MRRPVLDALASVINSSSQVLSSATLEFYVTGTSTPANVYTDHTLGTSLGATITANSSGRFPQAFCDPDVSYKAILKTSAGATVATIDPIFRSTDIVETSDLAAYLLKAGGTMTGAFNEAEGAAIASATTVNLDAATGNLVHITGTTTITGLTLAQGARRTLVFDGALTLTHSASLLLGGYDITTAAGTVLHVVGEGSAVTRAVGGITATGRPLFESAELMFKLGDETTAITTGTNKLRVRAPFAMILNQIPRASLVTAQASGSIVTFDINVNGSTILSTKLSIDNSETTSVSAATPAVLSTTTVADDDIIAVDIDQCDGSTTAAGAAILIRGIRRAT